MQQNCFICFSSFNENYKRPVIFCQNQHFGCNYCFVDYVQDGIMSDYKPRCQLCKVKIHTFSFRQNLYDECDQILVDKAKSQERQLSNIAMQYQNELSDLLSFKRENQEQQCLQLHLYSMRLIREGKYSLAESVLMATIQNYFHFADCEEFFGLGSMSEAFCRQSKNCLEYWQFYGTNYSLLDELSIRFSLDNSYEKGRSWFAKMTQMFPSNYKLFFSWGILEQNYKQNENALKWFYMAEQLYSLSNKQTNFCWLIQLKLQALKYPEANQEFLQSFLEKYPQYANILLWLADYHKMDKNHQKAIKLYSYYAKRYPSNKQISLKVGKCLFQLKQYTQALQYFDFDRFEKDGSEQQMLHAAIFAEWRGNCFHRLKMYSQACYWLDKKANIFNDQQIRMGSVVPLLHSLLKIKDYQRFQRLVFGYSSQLVNIAGKIFRKIFALFQWQCFQFPSILHPQKIREEGFHLLYNFYLWQQLGQIQKQFEQFDCDLEQFKRALRVPLRKLRNSKKSAAILERLNRYGEAISMLEECYRMTDSEGQRKELQDKIQFLNSKSA